MSYPAGAGNLGIGSVLQSIQKNATGALIGLTWAFPNGQQSVTDQVVRSQSGRILTNTATSGAVSNVSSYGYDAAGRLVTASIPRHQLTYSVTNPGIVASREASAIAGRAWTSGGKVSRLPRGQVMSSTGRYTYRTPKTFRGATYSYFGAKGRSGGVHVYHY